MVAPFGKIVENMCICKKALTKQNTDDTIALLIGRESVQMHNYTFAKNRKNREKEEIP